MLLLSQGLNATRAERRLDLDWKTPTCDLPDNNSSTGKRIDESIYTTDAPWPVIH